MWNMRDLSAIIFVACFCIVQWSASSAMSNESMFEGKRIFITGGTGYLGRAIATELLQYNPKEIVLYSRDEVKHFNAQTALRDPRVKSVLGDVRDYQFLSGQLAGVDIVFHTAALKRIDMLEEHVEEAIKTDVLGSLNLFHACCNQGVKKVVFISTDKACSPVNAYGAAKFLSEKIFTNYDKSKSPTDFVVVRYGNVLESTGSIIPVFADRMSKGESVSLTDERMTRFIISKQEAVELIFDALRYGIGGEIFVKKLSSLKIVDLISILRDMFDYKKEVPVTGIRPGEKIHEELINFAEISRSYDFKEYFVITPCIKDWIKNIDKNPIYVDQGVLMNEKVMSGFSSDMALVNKDAILAIFEKFKILSGEKWKE